MWHARQSLARPQSTLSLNANIVKDKVSKNKPCAYKHTSKLTPRAPSCGFFQVMFPSGLKRAIKLHMESLYCSSPYVMRKARKRVRSWFAVSSYCDMIMEKKIQHFGLAVNRQLGYRQEKLVELLRSTHNKDIKTAKNDKWTSLTCNIALLIRLLKNRSTTRLLTSAVLRLKNTVACDLEEGDFDAMLASRAVIQSRPCMCSPKTTLTHIWYISYNNFLHIAVVPSPRAGKFRLASLHAVLSAVSDEVNNIHAHACTARQQKKCLYLTSFTRDPTIF